MQAPLMIGKKFAIDEKVDYVAPDGVEVVVTF